MEKVTLEVLGIAVVAAVSYGITKLVTIAPFDRNYSANENVWMLISIPTVIYIIYRAYFGFVIFCCSKIRFPRIGKFNYLSPEVFEFLIDARYLQKNCLGPHW